MSKYLVLYHSPISPQEQMQSSSPDEAQAGIDAWTAWAGEAGPAIVDLGAPIASAGSVGPGGAGNQADGTGAGYVGGYSILQADSTADLERLLERHPHLMLDGSRIELYQFLELPGQ
jgi:hypothetical protein